MPTIAIVDSGIDARVDGRVVEQVSRDRRHQLGRRRSRARDVLLPASPPGARVATGAAPAAPIVSLDVMDDGGTALTSDVIAACDWILQNKARRNIRVANFSLHSSFRTSAFSSALNRAVERLWLSGVVVVAASGNPAAAAAAPPRSATRRGTTPSSSR